MQSNEKNIGAVKNRFYILDLLRFLAAVAVVFYHYSVYCGEPAGLLNGVSQYGYLGVDFFFLLSGFVIMASAQSKSPFAFMFARALRLYPAFIVCLLLTVAILYGVGGYQFPLKNIVFNATILNDYVGIPNIDGVYWTLQAELKFYGCVFLLILSGFFKYWRVWLAIWLAMAILHYFSNQPFFLGWFINPRYSFYFIAGVCAYLLFNTDKSIYIKIYFWVSAVFGVLVAGEQVKNFIPSPSPENVLVAKVVAAIFFLFFYCISAGLFNIKHPRWWWAYLGATSYPLYLLHNAMGKTLIDYFKGDVSLALLVPIVLLAVIFIALAVHILVEKPIARLKLG